MTKNNDKINVRKEERDVNEFVAPTCSKLSNNWTSIADDGLPEKYDIYLVCGWCLESGVPMLTTAEFLRLNKNEKGWIPDNDWVVGTTVTHWMPLPEPPETLRI